MKFIIDEISFLDLFNSFFFFFFWIQFELKKESKIISSNNRFHFFEKWREFRFDITLFLNHRVEKSVAYKGFKVKQTYYAYRETLL